MIGGRGRAGEVERGVLAGVVGAIEGSSISNVETHIVSHTKRAKGIKRDRLRAPKPGPMGKISGRFASGANEPPGPVRAHGGTPNWTP